MTNGREVAEILQTRLNAFNDLMLTLKHVHWNVIRPHFIAMHEMIDPHVNEVRAMVDETAERIATLGGSPMGTPGYVAANRSWDDYALGRATTNEHLGALASWSCSNGSSAHLESVHGDLATGNVDTERAAATRAAE